MAINGIMNAAASGLQATQTALTTISNNITNVDTPGYAREVVQMSPLVAGGVGEGVTVDSVQRVTNRYLEQANYQATAAAGSSSIISNLLDQAQSAFGDPSQATSYLNQLSSVFSDFTAAANDPASNLPRSQTIGDLTGFLDSTQNVAGTIAGLNTQADAQINSDVGQVNQLLSQISSLNTQISRSVSDGANASASQDSQSQLIGQLASLMTVNVTNQSDGTVVIRASNGQVLAGYGASATLAYTPSVSGAGQVSVTSPNGGGTTTLQVGDGELQGLMSLRNSIIPGVQAQLAAYVSGAVSTINAVHNANTAVPPPATLTGRDTGLDLATIAGDFTGKTNIAVVASNGALQQQVSIDFTAHTMSVNNGPATSFTPSTFLSSLNAALGGTATASFANGALSLSATGLGSGIAIADDAAAPATDGGQGFSQFFGLNDLVTSNEIANFNTGLKASDPSGFTAGGVITFQIADATGAPQATISVTMPTGSPTMQDLLNTLNAPAGGVGQYGAFSLDANGALSFAPRIPGQTLEVASDDTQRGTGGPSITQLFGVGAAQQASRAASFQIRPDIAADPMKLALARLDLSAAPGQPVVAIGDGSGATALAQAANAPTSFAAAGDTPATVTSVTQYAANLGGALGQKASAAASDNTAAKALATEAQTRLQSVEGVNLDEELVNLTTFQQAYNACARLVQASKDMINTLLDVVP